MGAGAFKPAWWLRSPHLQTLWPSLTRGRLRSRPQMYRERLELTDGDFLDLDWMSRACGHRSQHAIVLILHGLEGSSKSSYAWGMLRALQSAGFDPVVIHFRGCSGEPNRNSRSYHSGETSDIARVAAVLARRAPALAAVGFSLGGNVLLKWLGETGPNNPLTCATAISVPFRLDRCAQRLENGFSRLYQWTLMRSLRRSVSRKWHRQKCPYFVLSRVSRTRTFRQFDDEVTAPLHGFHNADDYYEKSSSEAFIPTITRQTLLIQAADDPFMYPDAIPDKRKLPPSVTLELSAFGGHVGFVGGLLPWRCEYWAETRTVRFLRAELGLN